MFRATFSAKQTGPSVAVALTPTGSPLLVARGTESSDNCVPQEEQNFQPGEQNFLQILQNVFEQRIKAGNLGNTLYRKRTSNEINLYD